MREEKIELPSRRDLPHTRAQLAAALGYSEHYISMMFRAGCPKDMGARASLSGVIRWLRTANFNSQDARAIKPLYPSKARRGNSKQK